MLIDAPGPPAPCTERALGVVARGGVDSPARLALGLGEEAEALWRWSGRGVESLLDRAQDLGVRVNRGGTWRLSLGPDEWREWETSARLLSRWGVNSRSLTATAVQDAGLGRGFEGGVWIGGEGQVDAGGLHAALGARLEGRITLRGGPGTIEASMGGVRIATPDGPVLSEIAVVAAGALAATAHPWFRPVILPVRLQGLSVPGAARPGPALARHRFEAWVSDDRGFSFVGCRWAEQPEMEAGVTDDETLSPAVEARAREFLALHHPDLDLDGATAWAGIAGFSCDGLPLVGALPGEARVFALCGWGGWGLSWMGAATDDLAAAILGEGAGETPSILGPRRLL